MPGSRATSNLMKQIEAHPAVYVSLLLAFIGAGLALYGQIRDLMQMAWLLPILLAGYVGIALWPLRQDRDQSRFAPKEGKTHAPVMVMMCGILMIAEVVVATGNERTPLLRAFPIMAVFMPAQWLAFFVRELRYKSRADQSAKRGEA